MQVLSIRSKGSTVYFLNIHGFVKGSIKDVSLDTKGPKYQLSYYVTCPMYRNEYQGDKIEENLLFDSLDQVISYYKDLAYNRQV